MAATHTQVLLENLSVNVYSSFTPNRQRMGTQMSARGED